MDLKKKKKVKCRREGKRYAINFPQETVKLVLKMTMFIIDLPRQLLKSFRTP